MSGPEYVEPWYLEVQKAAEAGSQGAIAAKDAADQVIQSQPVKPQSQSGWFNATTTLSDPNRIGGSRRRRRTKSRKSRRTRRR